MADLGRLDPQTVFNIQQVGEIIVGEIIEYPENRAENPALQGDELDRVLLKVQNSVLEKCRRDVQTPFRNLSIPDEEEYPELKRFQFYKGSDNPDLYTADRIRYMKRNYGEQQVAEFTKLHEESDQSTFRHVMLISPVGSGKTTLVKRYCRKALHGDIPALRGVRCVLFLLFQDIELNAAIPPEELLLGFVAGLTTTEKRLLFQWMESNSDKVLVAMDGLDQAPFRLENQTNDTVSKLFKGDLLPGCFILTSSREHAAVSLPSSIRPVSTVALAGLPRNSVERLIKGFGGRRGERIWQDIESKPANLVSLCQTPLFLILATAVYVEDPDSPPDTMSGLMMHVVLNFIHTDFSKEHANVLNKLMKLSFYGTENYRVTFSSRDLARFEIPLQDVKDLFVMTPRKTRRIVHQRLLEGDVSLFFCHLSFQETLSALHIIQMDLEPFTELINGELYNPHWKVVRRILCGCMLHPDTLEITKELIQDQEGQTQLPGKIAVLRRSIENELTSPTVSVKLNMFDILLECGDGVDDLVKQHIREVRLYYKILTKADMQCVASVCRRLDFLEYVSLSFCNLNEETLSSFEETMKASPTKIKRLDVPYNTYLGKEGCRALGRIAGLCRVDDLIIRNCTVNADELRGLKEALANQARKLPILDLCQNKLQREHATELLNLLPFVSDQIWVSREDIDVANLQLLERAIADLPSSNLELKVDTND